MSGSRLEGGRRKRDFSVGLARTPGLLSVVTVVREGATSLERTIKSILEQDTGCLEYIVVDGGSTDGTVDLIRRYEESIDFWVSESDGGIYDAMNKGISHATGAALLFLNSGDYFVGRVLTRNLRFPCFLRVCFRDFLGRLREQGTRDYHSGMPHCHQGIVFENRGFRYDLHYRLAGDYDFYLRHGYTYLPYHDSPGYVYYDNAGASTKNAGIRDAEIFEIIRANFGPLQAALFRSRSLAKTAARRLIGK